MTSSSKLVFSALAALSLGLASMAATAYPGGNGPGCEAGFAGGPGAGHMGMGPGMGHGPGPGMGPGSGRGLGNPVSMAEGRLAWLKSELKITAEQESAWKVFADQRRQQAAAMAERVKTVQDKKPGNAVERLEWRNQMVKQRQEQSEKMLVAFKSLYATLAPEQKAMLDQGMANRGFGPHRGPGRAL